MEDESGLIQELQQNSQKAIEQLVAMHGDRLLRSAYLICGNEADAQDIVQETFISAIKSIKKFQSRSKLYTWLHGILINVAHNFYRKQKNFISLEKIPEQAKLSTVQSKIDLEITSTILVDKINELPLKHREIITLRYFEQMKIREIAQHLKI
jgi:RNA polymerase sigma-70 factor (ECF subfamily)